MKVRAQNAGDAETLRLVEDAQRKKNWKRWGPYLAERQWGTVREDYSASGDAWGYLAHDVARSRAYRWGEDGLMGITDRECRLCFAVTLWNGKDPILKERLFGLSGTEGNHGEDVKELYYYLDSTPTHSYMKALYKYPQRAFPYDDLVSKNQQRGREAGEYEILDTGVFDEDRYFDVFTEYAKAGPDDILIRITVANRAALAAKLHVLPTLWFRNCWSWGCRHEGCEVKPTITRMSATAVETFHATLGRHVLEISPAQGGGDNATDAPRMLFTDNETNFSRLYGTANASPYVKDAFHRYLVHGETGAVNPQEVGTKVGFLYPLDVPAGGEATICLRLFPKDERPKQVFGTTFDALFAQRKNEADAFYADRIPPQVPPAERPIARQAFAGLLWSRQFYHYIVEDWLGGDPEMPKPPDERWHGRNSDWMHVYNRDVLSVPDKWEFPWFAAWDLAFHMLPMAKIDPQFAKEQLLVLLREWYMHPNGQIPAYEFCFNDVNPPVHAWACWRVYKITAPAGERDRLFLARAFQKLLVNFTWWVNRKDARGRHIFSGGFLGLDNIGLFDRSKSLPGGGELSQADGTAWMAFYCATMLSMAIELALEDPAYEDIASKLFEHFVAIIDAINSIGGTGLWDEADGFYYDHLMSPQWEGPLRVRSLVGLLPFIACEVLEKEKVDRLPGFSKRMNWFLKNKPVLANHMTFRQDGAHGHYLLAIPPRERLERMLRYIVDENEFWSPHGIRSLSKVHGAAPCVLQLDGQELRLSYEPGESQTGLFGGNSSWRGPVWFPVNLLIVEALERYHHFYGDELQVEFPRGSGKQVPLGAVAVELQKRLIGLFLPDAAGQRACHGEEPRYASDPHFKDLLLFNEYFHGDSGKGLGASHQTGWTAVVASMIVGCRRVE